MEVNDERQPPSGKDGSIGELPQGTSWLHVYYASSASAVFMALVKSSSNKRRPWRGGRLGSDGSHRMPIRRIHAAQGRDLGRDARGNLVTRVPNHSCDALDSSSGNRGDHSSAPFGGR